MARRQLKQHQRADDDHQRRVKNRARPHEAIDRGLAARAALDVLVGVVADQPDRAMDFGHHRVARVDTEAALDAAELRAVADVDPGRADRDALMAVDAVAGRQMRRVGPIGVFQRHPRFAAIAPVGHVERLGVGQRGLDARPRAHIEADLLAHMAGEIIGGEGEDADPDISGNRRFASRELTHQRRRVAEIKHPDAAGPPGDQQPRWRVCQSA